MAFLAERHLDHRPDVARWGPGAACSEATGRHGARRIAISGASWEGGHSPCQLEARLGPGRVPGYPGGAAVTARGTWSNGTPRQRRDIRRRTRREARRRPGGPGSHHGTKRSRCQDALLMSRRPSHNSHRRSLGCPTRAGHSRAAAAPFVARHQTWRRGGAYCEAELRPVNAMDFGTPFAPWPPAFRGQAAAATSLAEQAIKGNPGAASVIRHDLCTPPLTPAEEEGSTQFCLVWASAPRRPCRCRRCRASCPPRRCATLDSTCPH